VVFWKVRTKPYLAVGWLWYLGTLVPVIGLVQVGDQAFADRYSYVPLIGLFIMAAFGLPEFPGRLRYHKEILSFSAVAVLCVLGFLSWGQVKYWRDNLALYSRATTVVQDNWWAHYNLGVVLGEEGKFDEAISHYRETIRLRTDYVQPYSALATTLLWKGELDEAIVNFRKALQMKPDQPEVHVDLGTALARQRKLKEAKEHFAEALRLKPDFAEAHYNLGYALAIEGDLEGAINHCNQALQVNPDFLSARIQLANILARQNKIASAIETAEAALKLAENSGQKGLAQKIRNQLKMYKARNADQEPSNP
jgi:tetratricopeptide (TPR) repeat protein